MIFYFSAEGNSKAAAETIATILEDKAVSILSVNPERMDLSGETLGIVFPIYCWGVPPIMLGFIDKLSKNGQIKSGKKKIWLVCTCGDDVGMAPEMIKEKLSEKGLSLSGGWSVQMPNTYVALPGFDVDDPELERKKIETSGRLLNEIGYKIKKGDWEEIYVRGRWPRIKSGVLYPLFKRWGITPSKWHATEACVGCGICAGSCPVTNIKMVKRSDCHPWPKWGDECISCMACYHSCPRHAVEYGRITRGKGQYLYPRLDK